MLTFSSSSFRPFHIYFYLSFNKRFRKQYLRKVWQIQLAFIFFFILWRMYLSFVILLIFVLFFTWTVQLFFSVLLQHHISKCSRRLWSLFRRVQVSASCKATYFHKFKSKFLLKTVLLLFLSAAFSVAILGLIPLYVFRHLLSDYPDCWNIPHSSDVLYLS